MLALSCLYCAVPASGNAGAPAWDLYCAWACVQIWSNCSCVTTPLPTEAMAPAGTLISVLPHAAMTAGNTRTSRTTPTMSFFIDSLSQGLTTGRETHERRV